MALQNTINKLGVPSYYSGTRSYTVAQNAGAPTTLALTANSLRAVPWVVLDQLKISTLRTEVTVAAVGGLMRVALYSDTGSGYPGAIIPGSDVNTMAAATTGVKALTYATPITLLPGLYWQVLNANATPTIRALSGASISPVLGFNPAGGTAANYTVLTSALAFAAMPSTFPIGAVLASNNSLPLVMYQKI